MKKDFKAELYSELLASMSDKEKFKLSDDLESFIRIQTFMFDIAHEALGILATDLSRPLIDTVFPKIKKAMKKRKGKV
jgi:hypothetical protein